MPRNEDSFILDDKKQIFDFIAKISNNMYEYMKSKPDSKFVVFYKYLTHSDLATFGKSTRPNTLENNLLYYIDIKEMKNIEDKTSKPCLSLCLFSGSMDAMTVNATENSIENEIQQAYLEAIEAQNKRNDELELLIDKVDESWLIEDENGKMSWAITEEEKENIDVELVSFLDQSIKEKNKLIDDSIIVQSDGEILLTEEAEDDYFIQSGDFYVVHRYKKVWFVTIWIGFDVIANNPSAAIVLASAGILVDLAYLITDISILWKNLDAACAIALTYCRSLHEVVRQLGTLLMGIPKYILTAVEFMWRTIVVGSTGTIGIILSIAKLGLPSAAHGIDIINNASKGRGTTFHYTVLLYRGYTLH